MMKIRLNSSKVNLKLLGGPHDGGCGGQIVLIHL